MKAPIALLLCIVLSFTAGAVGSLLVAAPPSAGLPVQGAPLLSGAERDLLEDWRAARDAVRPPASEVLTAHESRRLATLEDEVARLEELVRELFEGTVRTPATEPAAADPVAQVAPPTRRAILRVMEEEEARLEAEREAERERRREQELQDRARRLAERAGLDPSRGPEIAEVMRLETARRNEALEAVRAFGGEDAREMARSAMQEVADWKRAELTNLFGAEAAEKLVETDSPRRNRGGRGRGGF